MHQTEDTVRLEAFSDGVFAIAITLLAFNVKIPKPEDLPGGQSLGRALMQQWPTYLAYFTSFLTILVMWINHHRLFKLIRRTNRPLMVLNGLLLMFVTLVPYPTALVAAYMRTPEARMAVQIYCGTFVMIALGYNSVWRYGAWGSHLIGADVEPAALVRLHQQYRFGPMYYVIAFAASFFTPAGSFAICMLVAIYFALPGLPARRSAPVTSG